MTTLKPMPKREDYTYLRHDVPWVDETAYERARADALQSQVDAMVKQARRVSESATRALGDHVAPEDCYSTGPATGNPIADLVACPGCTLTNEVAAFDALLRELGEI